MKTILVSEVDESALNRFHEVSGLQQFDYQLSLTQTASKACTGCWTCWWKTPGRCVYKDLDAFYKAYVNADQAVFYASVKRQFVSSDLKCLFDRMIPLFLPYTDYRTGESMHVKRYDRYPQVRFYYEGTFEREEDRVLFEQYVHRVFYQFHSEKIEIQSVDWALQTTCLASVRGTSL